MCGLTVGVLLKPHGRDGERRGWGILLLRRGRGPGESQMTMILLQWAWEDSKEPKASLGRSLPCRGPWPLKEKPPDRVAHDG